MPLRPQKPSDEGVRTRTGEFLQFVAVQPSSSGAQALRQMKRYVQWTDIQANARLQEFFWVRALFCVHPRRVPRTATPKTQRVRCSPGAPAGYYVWLTTAGLFCGRGATPLHSQAHTRSHQCSGAGAMAVYTFLAPSCWSRQRDIGTTVQTLTITPQLDDMDARALVVEDLGLSASRISTSRFGVAKLQKHRCWPRDVCTEVHSPYTQKMPKKKIKNNRTRQHSTLQPQVFVNALRRSVRSRTG